MELDQDEYRYYKRSEETGGMWAEIDTSEGIIHMGDKIGKAYVNKDMIYEALHDGLVVRTPFAQYKAVLIDEEE